MAVDVVAQPATEARRTDVQRDDPGGRTARGSDTRSLDRGTQNVSGSPRARHFAAPPFDVHVQPDRVSVRVVPIGELDLATVERLHATVEELVAAGFERVVIDLRELIFIDCAGLRLLCTLHELAREEDWQLALVQGRPAVRRLFAMTGTLEELPFQTSPPARRTRRAISQGGARAARRGRRPRSQH